MREIILTDNQAIDSRFGEAVWLTDFITPENPEVVMLYERLTLGIETEEQRAVALWRYCSDIPYRKEITARIIINGKSSGQKDTWLFPAEVITLAPVANCANKSFLLASLLRVEFEYSQVGVALGHLRNDGIGGHAWVVLSLKGDEYILEPTVPDISRGIIPLGLLDTYDMEVYFNDKEVYIVPQTDAAALLNGKFGFCAVPFLKDYICERCKDLEG